jgi:predicted nucleic acid-binding protein
VITVSNTTAITTLLKVEQSDLLGELFGEVWIPSAVEQELLAIHASIPPRAAGQ